MCGISGILSNKTIDKARILAMSDAIQHRGPDGKWEWYSPSSNVGLAYRRLAIIDRDAYTHQPFIWQDKYAVLFNGEIYNYKILKSFLQNLGFTFQTLSDAEVIPPLYHLYGTDMAKHLKGMFAIAIYEIATGKLFAVRDRLGEKPFYYTQANEEFAFASEMKALWAAGFSKEPDGRMVFDYLVYNVVEDATNPEKTFYKNIYRLPAAHWLLFEAGQIQKGCYWKLSSDNKFEGTLQQAIEKTHALFDESVKSMLQSDAPLGFAVSGGLDSSAIFSQAMKHLPENSFPQTFTARVAEQEYDEGPYVKSLLLRYAAHNTQAWINEDLILQQLPEILYHQEEPITDLTVLAQWSLMKKVGEKKIKVLLDGQGADEMLGGYLYFYETLLKEYATQSWRKLWEANKAFHDKRGVYYPLKMRMAGEIYFPRWLSALGHFKRRLLTPGYFSFLHRDFLEAHKHHDTPFQVFNKVEDLFHYRTTQYGLHKLLRYADRNSMAHSVEVRFPFLDHELVTFIFSLPLEMKIHDGWTKYILRLMMDKQLPSSITWRINKLGYHVPADKWLEHPRVKEMIREAKRKLVREHIIRRDDKPHTRDLSLFIISHFL